MKRQTRFKTKENNANDAVNTMIVEFNEIEFKNKAIKNSYKLRNFRHKVFVNNDLTESERIFEKKLRDERNNLNNGLTNEDNGMKYSNDGVGNYHYGIRNGFVKKIYHK